MSLIKYNILKMETELKKFNILLLTNIKKTGKYLKVSFKYLPAEF